MQEEPSPLPQHLSRFGKLAMSALKDQRPKMYAALEKAGTLRQYALERQAKAVDAMIEYEAGRQLTYAEAEERVTRDYLVPPASEEEQAVLGASPENPDPNPRALPPSPYAPLNR